MQLHRWLYDKFVGIIRFNNHTAVSNFDHSTLLNDLPMYVCRDLIRI